jgi:hypothetical protein
MSYWDKFSKSRTSWQRAVRRTGLVYSKTARTK